MLLSFSPFSFLSVLSLVHSNTHHIHPIDYKLLKFPVCNILLAESAQNKCTSLVCSCYVPSRNSDSDYSITTKNNNSKRRRIPSSNYSKDHGVMMEKACNRRRLGLETNHPLKSSMKRSVSMVDENQQSDMGSRKVSWSDSHGKDIAHVQEFETSVSEDGELRGVQKSCVCAIQ